MDGGYFVRRERILPSIQDRRETKPQFDFNAALRNVAKLAQSVSVDGSPSYACEFDMVRLRRTLVSIVRGGSGNGPAFGWPAGELQPSISRLLETFEGLVSSHQKTEEDLLLTIDSIEVAIRGYHLSSSPLARQDG